MSSIGSGGETFAVSRQAFAVSKDIINSPQAKGGSSNIALKISNYNCICCCRSNGCHFPCLKFVQLDLQKQREIEVTALRELTHARSKVKLEGWTKGRGRPHVLKDSLVLEESYVLKLYYKVHLC